MKTINYNYWLIIIFSFILVSGCTRLEDSSKNGDDNVLSVTISATSSVDDDTKAGYDMSNNYSLWDTGDKIGVSVENNYNIGFEQSSHSADYRNVTFQGTLSGCGEDQVSLWAKYPYISSDNFTSASLNTNLTDQTYRATGYYFPLALAHYYGVISNSGIDNINLKFSNPLTTLRIEMYTQTAGANVYSIVFQGNNGEKIGGTMVFNFSDDGKVSISRTSATSETITLNVPRVLLSTNSEAPSVFYISVPNIDYSNGFSITVNTTKGKATQSKSTQADFSAKGNTIISMPVFEVIPQVIIPNADFRNYLLGKGYIESADNEIVTITETGLAATSISLSDTYSKSATDISGIEYFPALTSISGLKCSVTSIDVSHCYALKYLSCVSSTYLTSLTLNNSTLLQILLPSCNLQALDLSGCTSLEILSCSTNRSLSSIKIPTVLNKLKELDCSKCALTSLDIKGCISLENLYCYDNHISSLDASKMVNPDEYSLYCGEQTIYSPTITGITLHLTLNSNQVARWNDALSSDEHNTNVALAE